MTRRMTPPAALKTAALILALALGLGLSACKRKPEDLEVWRPSKAKNGLEKLGLWIASPDELMPTRLRAAEILMEEEYAYSVDIALEKCSDADKQAILAHTVPLALGWYKTGDATVEAYQEARSKQVVGKDGAYFLLKHVTKAEDKEALEGVLIDWLTGDYFTRDQMGKVKLNQIAEMMGSRSAPPLLKALDDPKNGQTQLAQMLRAINDPAVKKDVALALVKQAEATLPTIDKDLETALLEEDHEAVVPFFVKIVPMEEIDAELRSAAFERVRVIKGKASMPIFLEWVKNGSEILRWLAIQGIAETQGKAGLGPILASLPLKGTYGEGDPEGFKGEAERFCSVEVKEMKETEPVFIQQLESGSWPAKAISMCCLQFVGSAASRPAVEKLKDDKTEIPNWGSEVKTLGDLAAKTLEKLPN